MFYLPFQATRSSNEVSSLFSWALGTSLRVCKGHTGSFCFPTLTCCALSASLSTPALLRRPQSPQVNLITPQGCGGKFSAGPAQPQFTENCSTGNSPRQFPLAALKSHCLIYIDPTQALLMPLFYTSFTGQGLNKHPAAGAHQPLPSCCTSVPVLSLGHVRAAAAHRDFLGAQP